MSISFLVNGEKLNINDFSKTTKRKIKLSDTSFEVDFNIIELDDDICASNWVILYETYPIANSSIIKNDIDIDMFSSVRAAATKNVDDRNELWPANHSKLPNSKRVRVTDKSFETGKLLNKLSSALKVATPPVDHCKIGLKLNDVLDLSELHVDRFEGMRDGLNGRRRRISRHFVNIGDTNRNVAFSLHNPILTEKLVPDIYSKNYLDALLREMGGVVDLVVAKIPPKSNTYLRGVRYLSSHILHVEYGEAGDFCAVVNSDSDSRWEDII